MKIAIPMSDNGTLTYLNMAYVDYIINAGYTPVLVTPEMDLESVEKECDGLILPGGKDIDPTYYGYNNISSKLADRDKDDFERTLYGLFLQSGKKIFGICRGFQLIFREYLANNDTKNFEYKQDISGHSQTGNLDLDRNQLVHSVEVDKKLYNDKIDKKIFTNSMHHQCVKIVKDKFFEVMDGIRVLGYTEKGLTKNDIGYVLEAFETIDGQVRAVQFHPEELNDIKLLQTFFGKGE